MRSEHCDLSDMFILAQCDVVRIDLVDLVVWAIVRLGCGNQSLSEQAKQSSFGDFENVHWSPVLWCSSLFSYKVTRLVSPVKFFLLLSRTEIVRLC